MKVNFEYFTNLQYKVKSLVAKVKAFESGEAIDDMEKEYKKELAKKMREIKTLKEQRFQALRQWDEEK